MAAERLSQFWQNQKNKRTYRRIVHEVHDMQRMHPDAQTTLLFDLVRSRPELRDHEEDIREAHTEMLAEHDGQPRKQGGNPYRVHPEQVAVTVVHLLDMQGKPVTVDTFKAGLHHDVWEDGQLPKPRRLVHPSDLRYLRLVEAVTRHHVKNDLDGTVRPISHLQSAIKVREAHEAGVEDTVELRTSDSLVNIEDQPDVAKPPLLERLLYSRTKEYKNSLYASWKKLKKRKKKDFIQVVLHDQPPLRGVVKEGIRFTRREINRRPRKSVRLQQKK